MIPVTQHDESEFAREPLGRWALEDAVPAELALVYDFANTLDERTFHPHRPGDRRDLIDTPAALRAWLEARGFSPGAIGPADVERAHALRAAIRAAVAGSLDPKARPGARATFREVAGRFPLEVGLDDDGRPELRPTGSGVDAALGAILAQAVRAAAGDGWARLKTCSADDCRWVFYDASRPRTGRWCSMTSCGNRAKTRAYRERRASTGRP